MMQHLHILGFGNLTDPMMAYTRILYNWKFLYVLDQITVGFGKGSMAIRAYNYYSSYQFYVGIEVGHTPLFSFWSDAIPHCCDRVLYTGKENEM